MSNYDDKSKTCEFDVIKEEKPQVRRQENDAYSSARQNREYESGDSGNKGLVYITVILAILLVVAIVAAVFILNPGNKDNDEIPENEIINTIEDTEDEEMQEEENTEENITVSCSMIFYSDSIIKKNGEYSILADLYDKDFYKFDNRKLFITDETDIREDGKRLSADALVYLIESMAGDGIVFDGEIREKDNTVVSIKFDGSFREELEGSPEQEEEGDGEETPEETPVETPEESTQTPPAENSQPVEGSVTE